MLAEGQQLLLHLPEKYPALIGKEQIEELIVAAGQELGNIGQHVLSFSLAKLLVLIGVLIYVAVVPILCSFSQRQSPNLGWMEPSTSSAPSDAMIWSEMNDQVANYVRGKAIEILAVFVASLIAFMTLGLNYALIAVGGKFVGGDSHIGAVVVTLPVALIGFFQWGWSQDLCT